MSEVGLKVKTPGHRTGSCPRFTFSVLGPRRTSKVDGRDGRDGWVGTTGGRVRGEEGRVL